MTNDMQALGLADLEAMAAEIDPQQDRDSDLFRASVVVLTCLFKGTDAGRIAEVTGYDTEFLEFLLSNLADNDQAVDGKLHVDWVTDDGIVTGGFLATVLCAAGMIKVQYVPDAPQSGSPGTAYQHPDQPELVWLGRGRRQDWLNDLLDGGAKLTDLVVT